MSDFAESEWEIGQITHAGDLMMLAEDIQPECKVRHLNLLYSGEKTSL
jgi:hypothetical protein